MKILSQELSELKKYPNWVAFRLINEAGQPKPRKKPFNPRTGKGAMANNPATWATFEQAVSFAEREGLFRDNSGGIGFELGNSPYVVIDLDHVVKPDGTLTYYAREIVEIMNSYTEYSPSGTGLHVWFTLDKPLEAYGTINKNTALDIEIYDTGRYITITGNVYGKAKPIINASQHAQKVFDKYFIKKTDENANNAPQNVNNVEVKRKQSAFSEDLIEIMFNAKNGDEIRRLYNGDISGYHSHSEADLALCNHFAFYTHNDAGEIDRLYRQSGLMRPKWDEIHSSGKTYGEMTIEEAIRGTNKGYDPDYKGGHETSTKATVKPQRGNQFDTHTQPEPQTKWQPPLTGYDYVSNGGFKSDLLNFQKFPEIFTGFDNLDKEQGSLYPGVYGLGAISSLGKTSFCLQIADNIARAGTFVLYFALEQNRLELTAKTISRLTAQNDIQTAISSMNIRREKFFNHAQREAYERAIREYQIFSGNIAIIGLGLNATISTITNEVQNFIDYTGLKPVVFVDYLQVIRPDNERQATKDFVDFHMRTLKKLQSDNELVLILISSFNRANYTSPVDYENFKETGSIEYTADVLWGLQVQIMATDDVFLKDEKVNRRKREAIDRATQAIPRKVMLKNLKNRYGRKGYSCGFIYDPRFDYFIPDLNFKVKDDNNEKTIY